LTPKSSKYSPKISPVYSSIRAGMTMKPDINSKIKVTRPSTSKNSNTGSGQGNFFHSKDNNVYSNSSNMGHNSTS
jgi:hypothetical protein